MTNSTLIRKVYLNCPICDKSHEVEERQRIAKIIIKDDEIEYKEEYYYCPNVTDDEENEFELPYMTNENLLAARNAYRIKHGLLTSNDIVEIRENYDLSQVEFARLMGWGEATISRYESKAIQDEAYDTMLRLVKDSPLEAMEMLEKNKNKFSGTRINSIRNRIKENINLYGKEYLSRKVLISNYIDLLDPSDLNGYRTLNISKIEACISFMAKEIANLYKVKLMKLLWYTDALSYKNYGAAITGLVYVHEQMGALPIGHYSLVNLENLNIREEMSQHYDNVMLHFYETDKHDYSSLSDDDLNILNAVIIKFKHFSATDIVNYMHRETAYKKTKPGEYIPFSLAKEIKDFQ